MAAVDQDDSVKHINFEEAVTYFLPNDPVASKKKTDPGAMIFGTVGATGSPAKVDKTGVKLCWHDPKLFDKLTKEQKTELQKCNRENPTKRKTTKGTGRRVKACVAAANAQSDLITAMAELHTAAMEVVKAKLSQMTASTTFATHAPTAITRTVGFTFGAEVAALEESAWVSSVKMAGILKKVSPKPAAP